MAPRHDNRDPARAKFGKPSTQYPQGSLAHPTITEEREARKSAGNGNTDFLTPHPNTASFPGAVLTAQISDKGDDTDKRVTEIYETLPGPWIETTEIDPDGVQVTIRTRKNRTSDIASTETVAEGLWTRVTKGEGDAITAQEIESVRAIPGNPLISTEVGDGFNINISKTLKVSGTITTGEAVSGSAWTKTHKEDPPVFRGFENRCGDLVAWEVVESIPIPSQWVSGKPVDGESVLVQEQRRLNFVGAITQSATATQKVELVEYPDSSLIAWEKVTTLAEVFDAKEQSISQAVRIPTKFFPAGVTVSSTSITTEGTSTTPDALGTGGLGVLSSRKRRVTTKKIRSETEFITGGVPSTSASGEETNEGFRDAVADINESFNSGLHAEIGPLILSSVVEQEGGGKQLRKTIKLRKYPSKIVLYGSRHIGIPARLYYLNHRIIFPGSSRARYQTIDLLMDSATVARCPTRTTIEFSKTPVSLITNPHDPVTKDVRYDGPFLQFSFNNVLCDNLVFIGQPLTHEGWNWQEAYSFPATPVSASGYGGHWYILSQEAEPWGTSDYKITTVEYFSPSNLANFGISLSALAGDLRTQAQTPGALASSIPGIAGRI